jgi:hypothetical protein
MFDKKRDRHLPTRYPIWEADAEDTRSEAAESWILTGIIRELLVGITGNTDVKRLCQEMRCAPVEVEIDAASLLGIKLLKVVGEAGRDGIHSRWWD